MSTWRDVCAVLVTKGDVDLQPVIDSLIWDTYVVWDNSRMPNLKVFGRHAAVCLTDKPIIYFQDDDAIVSPEAQEALLQRFDGDLVVNMPGGHNEHFPHLKLLGWGSICPRDFPARAHEKVRRFGWDLSSDDFLRLGCDIAVSVLSPSRRFDLGHQERPFSHTGDRIHRSEGYQDLKRRLYDECAAMREEL